METVDFSESGKMRSPRAALRLLLAAVLLFVALLLGGCPVGDGNIPEKEVECGDTYPADICANESWVGVISEQCDSTGSVVLKIRFSPPPIYDRVKTYQLRPIAMRADSIRAGQIFLDTVAPCGDSACHEEEVSIAVTEVDRYEIVYVGTILSTRRLPADTAVRRLLTLKLRDSVGVEGCR